jgi:hypothetical protein
VRFTLGLAAALLAGPLAAQDRVADATPVDAPQPLTAEQMVEAAREKLRPPEVRKPCPPAIHGEIVVCGEVQHSTGVPSSLDDAIAEGRAVPDGKPRAPDVLGMRPCSSYTVCSRMGRAPRPVPLIDLKTIPEAPPGSDAARYREDADADEAAAKR